LAKIERGCGPGLGNREPAGEDALAVRDFNTPGAMAAASRHGKASGSSGTSAAALVADQHDRSPIW
jgi:hypothetical protein